LGPNFQFGGGASESSITPAVLALTILAVVLVLVLPRKYAVAPILVVTFLTPFGEQILAGGLHLYVIRILVLASALRLLIVKLLTGKPLFAGGLNGLDKVFCLWAFIRGIAYILLLREGGAVLNQMGAWLDLFGVYFLFRYLIQDKEDISRAIKMLALIAAVLAACMFYEHQTRINVFSNLAGHAIVPWIRNGSVRAQGVFGNSITAGTFGAVLLPLFFWLWKSGKARLWGVIGLAAATIVAVTSMASTPFTGMLAAILALCLWPIRKQMRWVRWGLVCAVLGLALVMKAPVWYVITKVNFVGGDSWDRANLITQTVNHFSEWWLLGTTNNANWGDFTWDQCNQFAGEALQGGLATLILFLAILTRGFSRIGRCRELVERDRQEWFFWCLGAALFANVIVFLGIDYFDQTRTLWVIFLAMISVATVSADAVLAPESKLVLSRGEVQYPVLTPGTHAALHRAAHKPGGSSPTSSR
jgi:hypothetical protein